MKEETSNILDVGPDHNIWTAIYDDDWCGYTLTNWMNYYAKGAHIRVSPPSKCESQRLKDVLEALRKFALVVEIL